MQMVGVTFTPAKNRHMEVLVYTSQKRAYGGVTFTLTKIGHMNQCIRVPVSNHSNVHVQNLLFSKFSSTKRRPSYGGLFGCHPLTRIGLCLPTPISPTPVSPTHKKLYIWASK